MTLYYVSIGVNEYQIEISDHHYKINGESIRASLVKLGERGLFMLKKGLWKRELHVQPQGNSAYALNAGGRQAVAKVEKITGRLRKKASQVTAGDITAPISGVVVKVNIKAGDTIAEGDVALVLESMKMQMLMRAPQDGTVAEVRVSPGAQVAKGEMMVRIE